MDRYDKDKIIGSGTFGNVYIIRSKLSRQAYVLKEVGLNSLSETEQQQAQNEVSVLAKCKHKNIIRYKEAHLQDNKVLSIVMEYADGGDLFAAIQKQNGVPFNEHRVIKWFIEISLALQYIHHKNILHRDLKSQNVFLTKSKVIKIGDFGISRVLKGPEELAKTAIGTPYYISPEICQRKPYNYKSDIWALGCLLFEMATLEHAFQAQDFFHLVTLIINGKRKDLPRHCGNLIRDLVSSLLKVDPDERPSTRDILSFPSLQSYLSEKMIDENICESTLMNTMELNKRKGSHVIKDGVKRRASISYLNPKESKQRTSPRVEATNIEPPIQRSNTTNARIESLKKLPRPIPLTRAQILRQKKHHVTYRSQSPKVPVQKDQSTQSSFTVSCETYSFLPSTSATRSCLTKSEDSTLEDNCCFRAKEHSILTPTNSFTSTISKIFSFSKFRRNSDDSKVVSSPENPLRNVSSGFIDSYDSSREGSVHQHCRHSQCNQCVLGMLWRNRIRSKARGSVDSDEYLELKEKLLMVFKKDLFNKVYESLMYDWELTHVNASNAFQGILTSLTYEQVQSLPLMMQLIQLDLLRK